MKAKVIKEFPGRPDHEAMTRTITVGEIVEGDLAAVAIREEWAEEVVEVDDATGSEAANADEDKPNFGKMTVEALTAFAAENDIDLGGAAKKADIVAAIEAATSDAQ